VKIVCEHKADVAYPVVSAASIVAKTVRDEQVRLLEQEIGESIGSGYAHDPVTRALLEKWIREKGQFPPQTRRSWATAKRAESMAKNARLSDWDD
jgi:ribonuclease HII